MPIYCPVKTELFRLESEKSRVSIRTSSILVATNEMIAAVITSSIKELAAHHRQICHSGITLMNLFLPALSRNSPSSSASDMVMTAFGSVTFLPLTSAPP